MNQQSTAIKNDKGIGTTGTEAVSPLPVQSSPFTSINAAGTPAIVSSRDVITTLAKEIAARSKTTLGL
jgi:hypothetical protein